MMKTTFAKIQLNQEENQILMMLEIIEKNTIEMVILGKEIVSRSRIT